MEYAWSIHARFQDYSVQFNFPDPDQDLPIPCVQVILFIYLSLSLSLSFLSISSLLTLSIYIYISLSLPYISLPITPLSFRVSHNFRLSDLTFLQKVKDVGFSYDGKKENMLFYGVSE